MRGNQSAIQLEWRERAIRRAFGAQEILTGILGRCLRLAVSSVVDAKPIPAKRQNVAAMPAGDAKIIVGTGRAHNKHQSLLPNDSKTVFKPLKSNDIRDSRISCKRHFALGRAVK